MGPLGFEPQDKWRYLPHKPLFSNFAFSFNLFAKKNKKTKSWFSSSVEGHDFYDAICSLNG
jgi:hypothetical protein